MRDLQAPRPRVSRETRLLFVTIACAIAALWVLGRLRFPERASTSPVPAVLAPLALPSSFDELAGAVTQFASGLAASTVGVAIVDPGGDPGNARVVQALRWRDDLAVVAGAGRAGERPRFRQPAELLAYDPATSLAVARLPGAPAAALATWDGRRVDTPRYFVSSDRVGMRVTWRPVFVGGFSAVASPRWQGELWEVPARTDLTPGAFLFTLDGQWAGVTVEHRGRVAVVPPALLTGHAEDLLRAERPEPAGLGIDVTPLSPGLSAATGREGGVIVSHVDPRGPAAGLVLVGDVIDAVGPVAVGGIDDWRAIASRLVPRQAIDLHVHRQGMRLVVPVVAVTAPAVPLSPDLGVVLRDVPGTGSTVTRVAPLTAAERAGLQAGDVVTLFGDVAAPGPRQILRAWASAPGGRPLVVAVTRNGTHLMLAVER